jgi:hypothetical protein
LNERAPSRGSRSTHWLAWPLVCLALFASCRQRPSGAEAPASVEPPPAPVVPVYPHEVAADEPLAVRLCEALHDLAARRRADCCRRAPGTSLAAECARVLSAALRNKAVRLDAAELKACRDALDRELTGCDWVGPLPPPLPVACDGIVRGLLPAQAPCRSSLECARELRCRGAGPTSPGVCEPARAEGACELATDTLAAYTRQDRVDELHPECLGFCDRHGCGPVLALGAACVFSPSCGRGHRCAGGRCVDGGRGKEHDACTGADCEPGLRCVKARCLRPATTGTCTSDFECRGGCVKAPGATTGVCGARC